MKNTLLSVIALAGLCSVASATVTYQFSSTSVFATNFLSGSGASNATMVWGIVVDAAGNGFSGANAETPYDAGFTYSSASTLGGVALSTVNSSAVVTASDDVLYISGNLMNLTTNTNDSATLGLNRITNLSGISYTLPGVAAGDNFRVIWFDITALGGVSADGTKYGMFQMPSNNTLLADPGVYPVSAAFAGADDAKAMSFTLGTAVPEPSVALLGALGVFGLMRRRR